jgi:prevent-host-death family protein
MTDWQLAEAEARLEELVERSATDGPQHIVEDGKAVAVLVSFKNYKRMVIENPPLPVGQT